MSDTSIDHDLSHDWIESSSARQWARTDSQFESIPSFGSSARSELQQAIADDEAEIIRLEVSTPDNGIKLQELKETVGRNQVRLAPILLIPNETLSAIFIDCLYLRYVINNLPKFGDFRFVPPSTIMQVCRCWSACAISTPAIWTYGRHVIDASDITSFDHTRLLKSYFDRAGSHSLRIAFRVGVNHHRADNIWCKIVEPSLFRMEDMEIHGKGNYNPAGSLRALFERLDRNIVTSLTSCTRLRLLSLCGIHFPKSDSQIPILLPALRNIDYIYCNGNPPIQCPALVSCEIRGCSLSHSLGLSFWLSASAPLLEAVRLYNNTYQHGQVPSKSTLLTLKVLSLDGCDDISIAGSSFDLPNLTILDIYLDRHSFERIEIMALSSYSALTSLTLIIASNMSELQGRDVQIVHEWMVQARNLVEFKLTFEPDEAGVHYMHGMESYIDPLLTTRRDPPCFPT